MIPHLYIHVPFCDGKCHYCGFYSVLNDAHLTGLYTPLPSKELELVVKARPKIARFSPRTVYMGGGTPALLGEAGLSRLIERLSEHLSFASVEEWTVELNPASVNRSLLNALRKLGVNRLSIGVQSFNDATLARIGRRHDARAADQAVHLAQETGFENTGIDLIAGLPGVTPAIWQATLEHAVSLKLKHLSVYALSVEPGTVLARQKEEGLVLPDDGDQLSALKHAEAVLGQAGFERYEISNYAQPGQECRHNLGIWRGNDYLGLGPAAASRLGDARWTNDPDVAGYMDSLAQKQLPPRTFETLTPTDDALERVTFALRLAEGIDPSVVAQRFACLRDRAATWEERFERLMRHGITERGGRRWRLTAHGREICDAVIRELL